MADNAVTRNVFLDTQVFSTKDHNFSDGLLHRVQQLASVTGLKILLTTVTEKEIRKHINEDAVESFRQLSNYKRLCRATKRLIPEPKIEPENAEAYQKELEQEFDTFLKDAKIEVVSIKDVNPEEVFKMYFEQKAPFGKQHKKNEFPDAFAYVALQSWCKRNRQTMYVVSQDKDWIRACKGNTLLIQLDSLTELLELYQDSVIVVHIKESFVKQRSEIETLIREEAENLEFYVDDEVIAEPEYEDLEIGEVEVIIEDYHVVQIENGKAVVSVSCNFTVTASVIGEDLSTGIYDHESKEVLFRKPMTAEAKDEFSRTVNLSVEYGSAPSYAVKFIKADIPRKTVVISVDEMTLETDDDVRDPEDYDLYDGDGVPGQE